MAYAAQRPSYQQQHSQDYLHNSGYNNGYNGHNSGYNQAPNYTSSVPLKPIPQITTTSYAPLSTAPHGDASLARLDSADAKHKRRIRILKAVSRVIATVLSLATFIPLATTLVKFFETRNEYMTVDGESRTAWASGTIAWYTYLYFGVATITLVLNTAILISYCCGGVNRANKTAAIEGWWSNFQRVVEILVWITSVAIYRYGKNPDIDGKFKDLWGWTCSPAAREIQDQITNIDFDTYCNVQTTSFYTGILNVLAEILTGCIHIYAFIRWRSKSKLRKATLGADGAMEPLRH